MVTCAAHKNKYLQACNPQTFNLLMSRYDHLPKKKSLVKIFQCNLRKSFRTFEFIAEEELYLLSLIY